MAADDLRAVDQWVKQGKIGKAYNDQATEVVSMGLEQLHRDPSGFAKDDPEYCSFILGVLDGSSRDVPIPE